MPRMTHIEPC